MIGFIEVFFNIITNPYFVLLILSGTLVGMVVGLIPGLGGAVAVALLIPFTFTFDPLEAMLILASAKGGVMFAGSITAILLNTPGSPANTPTLLDGPALARKGEAGLAIGISATASAGGAIIGIVLLVMLISPIQELVIQIAPPEFFVLTIVGILAIAVAVKDSMVNGLIGAALGFFLSFIGFDTILGGTRYVYDIDYLFDGVPLLPVIIGVFAVAEAMHLAGTRGTIAGAQGTTDVTGWTEGIKFVFKHKILWIQSAIVGFLVGAIPAVGGSIAGFISYVQGMSISKNGSNWGSGIPDALIATEGANDAKDAGDLVPTLALGIPGSVGAAVLLGAFLLHGLQPGPRFLVDHLDVAYYIFTALIISNILTSVIGLSFSNSLAKITIIPTPIIAGAILIASFPGAYATRNEPMDILLAFAFGILGLAFIIYNISRIAFIIAMILGPIAERTFHQSLQISAGDYSIFYTRPLTIVIVGLIIFVFLFPRILRRVLDRSSAPDG